jgi:hypothetical protein
MSKLKMNDKKEYKVKVIAKSHTTDWKNLRECFGLFEFVMIPFASALAIASNARALWLIPFLSTIAFLTFWFLSDKEIEVENDVRLVYKE